MSVQKAAVVAGAGRFGAWNAVFRLAREWEEVCKGGFADYFSRPASLKVTSVILNGVQSAPSGSQVLTFL